jgi:hypothetical protein
VAAQAAIIAGGGRELWAPATGRENSDSSATQFLPGADKSVAWSAHPGDEVVRPQAEVRPKAAAERRREPMRPPDGPLDPLRRWRDRERRQSAWDVLSLQTMDGFGLDVEVFCIGQQKDCGILELPIHRCHVSNSWISPLKDTFKLFRFVLRVGLNDWRGFYSTGE